MDFDNPTLTFHLLRFLIVVIIMFVMSLIYAMVGN